MIFADVSDARMFFGTFQIAFGKVFLVDMFNWNTTYVTKLFDPNTFETFTHTK